jgi:hypothetical protein
MILRKNIVLKVLFLLSTFYGCNSSNSPQLKSFVYTPPQTKQGFVQLKNRQFYIGDSVFFPVMLNYVAYIRKIGNEYVISPDKEYDNPALWEGNSKDSVLHVLKGHLTLIKELGFNSVR